MGPPRNNGVRLTLLGSVVVACQLVHAAGQLPFMLSFHVTIKEGDGSQNMAARLADAINTAEAPAAFLMPASIARVENSSFPPLPPDPIVPSAPAPAPAPVVAAQALAAPAVAAQSHVSAPALPHASGPAPAPSPFSAPGPSAPGPAGAHLAPAPAPGHAQAPAMAPAPAPSFEPASAPAPFAPAPAPFPAPLPAPAPAPAPGPAPGPGGAPSADMMLDIDLGVTSALVRHADQISMDNAASYSRLRARILTAAEARRKALLLGPARGQMPAMWEPLPPTAPPTMPPPSLARLVYDAIVNTPAPPLGHFR